MVPRKTRTATAGPRSRESSSCPGRRGMRRENSATRDRRLFPAGGGRSAPNMHPRTVTVRCREHAGRHLTRHRLGYGWIHKGVTAALRAGVSLLELRVSGAVCRDGPHAVVSGPRQGRQNAGQNAGDRQSTCPPPRRTSAATKADSDASPTRITAEDGTHRTSAHCPYPSRCRVCCRLRHALSRLCRTEPAGRDYRLP